MPHEDDVALLLGKRVERALAGSRARSTVALVDVAVDPDRLLGEDRPVAAQVVQCGVAGDPQQPAREGHAAVLVARDHRHQLHEHVLGDVFGVLFVTDDAADVAVDVVRIAHVEEADRVAVTFLCACYREANFTRDGG